MNIIIPAYQPDDRMIKLIQDIKTNSDYNIYIVDDGSGDRCRPFFEHAVLLGCTVLTHETNQGKGAALKTAFDYLQKLGVKDGFISADCDGQHTWTDIKRLAEELPSHPTSILLGSRRFVGKIPLRSRFGNLLTRSIFSLITGNKIADTQTGLRGFHADMLPWLAEIDGNRYEYEMNQLLMAKKAGYDFYSIPIETIYENNNKGSHFHPIRDSIRIYYPILKFGMSSILCGIIDFAMLFILKLLTKDLLIAVVGARVISSLCNYLLNKHIVFDTRKNKRLGSLIQYYLLVVFIMGCNYLLLSFFHENLGISLLISKVITEMLLFIVSYTVQHKIIFHEN